MPLDIGLTELMMVMVVVLIVFGPAKIPEIARGFGSFVRDMRQMANSFTSDLLDEPKPPPPLQRACAHCGSLNPVTHGYCGACGASFAASL
ncbi:MAG: Sec-independent protein translocase protein TatAy [Nitrospira sp.]|nr:Sec-independent protein translocase protein TatAy [Nitrospira sp.]